MSQFMSTQQDKHCALVLETLFSQAFESTFNTLLKGGEKEPFYAVAKQNNEKHCLYYREDFFASALHEIAHWCIAGKDRLQLDDFGYWYVGEERCRQQQKRFLEVEVKPQALEYLFSLAAGFPFKISIDNFLMDRQDLMVQSFSIAVLEQAKVYLNKLPNRASQFINLLHNHYNTLPISEKNILDSI